MSISSHTQGFRNAITLCLLLAASPLFAAPPSAPKWAKGAADQPASFSYGKATAATLLDELFIDVSADGTFTHRVRGVTRILKADGRSEARAILNYNTESSRIISFQAWLIRPKGPVLVYGKDKMVENATYGTSRELYGAGRRQEISAVVDAEEGAVFIWESIREEKNITSQAGWSFAGRFPVECSRLSVRVPKGWELEPRFFNAPAIPSVTENGTTTWEQRQLPAVHREPFSPSRAVTQPFLGINIKPPATDKKICRKALFSWPAISAYFSPLYDAAATPSTEMKTKADEIVAGASTLAERISRLCLYAQKTNYISITLNADEGGGMIPQPAEKVFRCNYGDCKDKATFLRALLRTQGIESYPVIVYAGDHQRVRPEWPATSHFNHCILAIKVEDDIQGSALLNHPMLGRLMIFDPTSPYVAFGSLPQPDCGGYGLILSGPEGELLQLPALQPSTNQKTIAFEIRPDGSLTGTLARHITGPTAQQLRAEYRNISSKDFQTNQQKQIRQSMANAEVAQLEATDDFERGTFTMKLAFTANAYGKPMRDTLLVFKPVLQPASVALPNLRTKRTQPVRIPGVELVETTNIILPPGFAIDELPTNANIHSFLGHYTAKLEKTSNGLVLTRTLTLKETTAPAEKYGEIVQFAEKIHEAEQSPVVLKRQ